MNLKIQIQKLLRYVNNTTQAKYCHGSTIPYDLTGNANATVNITTWGGVTLNKDTFKTTVKSINDIVEQSEIGSGNEAKGTVVCQSNGTWKLGSGYHNMVSIEAHSFVVINGAKKSNKQFTIELWGGQGGGSKGGRGGYTKLVSQLGNKFNEGTVLYVGVGGKGVYRSGGYNGGGSSFGNNSYGGGGATHLATKSGVLSSLSGSKSSVIAVAGGGGGSSKDNLVAGGNGGGNNNSGNNGGGKWYGFGGCVSGNCDATRYGNYYTKTQGKYPTKSSFGLGGSCYDVDGAYPGGGGGSGYYGGGAGNTGNSSNLSGGGGGSGYCNSSYGSCSGSSGSRAGNGYAKITW